MGYNTKIRLNDFRTCQKTGDTLTLSGSTSISLNGDIKYVTTGATISEASQLTTKEYVDSQTTEASIYNLSSPATINVGGLPLGTNLTGRTSNNILEEILTPFQSPTFTSFSADQTSSIEVGTTISGSTEFSWSFSNVQNVSGGTMNICDKTDASKIATSISTTSPQSATINAKTFDSCGQTQKWLGSAKNINGITFESSDYTVTAYFPYFYGVCTCPGAAGEDRPTLSAGDITGGTKIVSGTQGSFSISFNSGDNDYLWFAIPASVTDKTNWCVTSDNCGNIGGGVSAGCNLFPDPVTVSNVENECWSSVSYDVYVSNKQTSISIPMEIS